MPIIVPEDSGNATIIEDSDIQNIRIRIRPDNASAHQQFFNFTLAGEPGATFKINIEGANEVSYPGWTDKGGSYRATASCDDETWSRLSTTYNPETGILSIEGQLTDTSLNIAFFASYPYKRHLELIREASTIPNSTVRVLGKTKEDRDITLLTIGEPGPDKKNIYVLARQHPGETMAEWFAEGLIMSLEEQPSEFFDHAVLYIVPNMNPDGSYHGNLRTNAQGKDLNREWDNYDNEVDAPEVFYVRREILKTGAALVLDIHGDETNPHVFPEGRGLGCTENPEMNELEREFISEYQKRAPYLKSESCYEPDEPGKANLGMAVKFFAERLGCLSMLFEMPNKELASGEDWTQQHCKTFGSFLVPTLIPLLSKLNNKRLEHAGIARGLSFLIDQKTTQPEVQQAEIVEQEQTALAIDSPGCCIIT